MGEPSGRASDTKATLGVSAGQRVNQTDSSPVRCLNNVRGSKNPSSPANAGHTISRRGPVPGINSKYSNQPEMA
ncbi:hypothetical protein GCM10007382_00090 [Salinibacterium xinjiangense]|nr:hypothetical protein GCM10007382_00090 [Salinibacterium xinjiangense]